MQQRESLAQEIVGTFRSQIVDYQALGPLTIDDDVLPTAIITIGDLLNRLSEDDSEPGNHELELESIRRSAARRVHQDVSLPALLHSYRIWGSRVWAAIATEAEREPSLRDAALGLASGLFDYVDRVSVAVAQVYLEESAGLLGARDVLRTDVLESLLLGRPLSDRARLDITRLNLTDTSRLAVVLVRLGDVPAERLRQESVLAVQACRETVLRSGSALIGVRDTDAISVVRIAGQADVGRLTAAANALAAVNATWRVCVGRPHEGLEGVPRSFHEAQEAAIVATMRSASGVAVQFSDVMLDRILVHSAYAEDLLDESVRPLVAYDAKHSSSLIETLKAYVDSDFNLTRTATLLTVNPNTIAYRMRRIGQLTGHNPSTSRGLVTLALAVRLLGS